MKACDLCGRTIDIEDERHGKIYYGNNVAYLCDKHDIAEFDDWFKANINSDCTHIIYCI